MASPNTQLCAALNQIGSLAQQAVSFQQAVDTLSAQFTAQGWATLMTHLTTVAINADGTPATTNDASPNEANGLTTLTPPGYNLNRLATPGQYTQALTVLQAVSSAVKGQVVTVDAGALAILDVFVGS